jgi:hypothetical protein
VSELSSEYIDSLKELDPRDIRSELDGECFSAAVHVKLSQVDTINVRTQEASATVEVSVDDALSELAEAGLLVPHVIAAYTRN